MSFPTNCAECGRVMQRLDDETDCCDNGACDWQGFPVPHEPDDPAEVNWLDGLEAA